MSITLLKAQESITESDYSFVGKEATTSTSTELSTEPSTESSTEPSSQSPTEAMIQDSTQHPTEDTTEELVEYVTQESMDESTRGSNDESTDGSTEIIEIIYQESQSSDANNTSESGESSESSESQEVIAEYDGFDRKEVLNGSDFSCYGRSFGQYADVSKDCHVFHLCYPFFNSSSDELLYQRITFLCDEDSVFDQKRFVCVDNSTVEHKCSDSPLLYQSTNEEYLIKVFSQNVSPADEVNGKSDTEESTSSWGWFNWFYRN